MLESPYTISSGVDGVVTINYNKDIKIILSSELVDSIVALRKKAKLKKCWIGRPIPAFYWEDRNEPFDQRRKARSKKVPAATRDEGQ